MLDHENEPIHDWDIIYKSYTWKCLESLYDKTSHKKGCIHSIKTHIGYAMYAYLYDLCTTYIESHEQALMFLHEISDETESRCIERVTQEADA